ncbi:hypothetical protein F3Y22_tig00110429pilonHSYRG00067 [Hibiscus syriacus]|uniref:Purple acid phosphatase Fn3-like domain-containing protein n=1 Tax=Hibiscus syriacus TaxID=106335 RepID=A0A6A3AMC4_HIBSY|nr:hypothetical protein F3Y22_tig00110429pilonHSYRG00067 [Hibiscus syriacus]
MVPKIPGRGCWNGWNGAGVGAETLKTLICFRVSDRAGYKWIRVSGRASDSVFVKDQRRLSLKVNLHQWSRSSSSSNRIITRNCEDEENSSDLEEKGLSNDNSAQVDKKAARKKNKKKVKEEKREARKTKVPKAVKKRKKKLAKAYKTRKSQDELMAYPPLAEPLNCFKFGQARNGDGVQPLSKIAIHKAVSALNENASVKAHPLVLGTNEVHCPKPSESDWIAVFSPANFNSTICQPGDDSEEIPYICSAPIKYKYANDSNAGYKNTGRASLKISTDQSTGEIFNCVIFQRDIGLAVSNVISFVNPKAPLYPRLSQGKSWNEMTVTWTSGYNIIEAVRFVEWGMEGESQTRSPPGTLTFHQNETCAPPARTVDWRDPCFIHTGFLKDLWPNSVYAAQLTSYLREMQKLLVQIFTISGSGLVVASCSIWRHGKVNWHGIVVHVKMKTFYNGFNMFQAERDGSNEYKKYQPGSLNTTDQLIKDFKF